MQKILVTGATGNIGKQVIRFLLERQAGYTVIAGVRNVERAQQLFADDPGLQYVHFDFEDPYTFDQAFEKADTIFLLRPPHLSDVNTWFRPLVNKMKEKGVRQVVFLSVQGADKSKVIPHNKIERLILASGMDYIFIRPGYFMQNLTTTLKDDIRDKRKIILPAGRANFNWIDTTNIGEAAAVLLAGFEEHKNQIGRAHV